MAIAVAVLASLGFIAWIIYRAVKVKSIRPHQVSYGVAIIAATYTFAYFLSMDLPQLIKIVVSIIFGIALIIFTAIYQRRRTKRS